MTQTDPFTSSAPNVSSKGLEPAEVRAKVKRDGYGRYLIPALSSEALGELYARNPFQVPDRTADTPWTRATTFAKSISDTYTLSQWSQRMAVKGLSTRPDLIALAASADVNDKSTLDSVVEQAKDAAKAKASANLGTAMHAFTEQVDRGEELPDHLSDVVRADLTAYKAAREAAGVRAIPGMMERQVVIPEYGVAGTFDRIDMGPDRLPVVGDVKTGRDLQYGWNEIAIQLWLYANASAIWDPNTRTFHPMPEGIQTAKALVFHLPIGKSKCDIYSVDLELAGEAVELCHKVRNWRKVRNLAKPVRVVEVRQATIDHMEATAEALNRGESVPGVIACGPDQILTDELAPLAGPGQKGCSVCHRTGHRKGSPKCLVGRGGTENPATQNRYPAQDGPSMTDEETAAVPASWCTCTKRETGWTDVGNGVWVCGDCRKPSRAGMINGTNRPVATDVDRQEPGIVLAPAEAEAESLDSVLGDPFAEPQKAAPAPVTEVRKPSLSERIAAASSVGELRTIGAEAMAAGTWTPEIKAFGLLRMRKLQEPAG